MKRQPGVAEAEDLFIAFFGGERATQHSQWYAEAHTKWLAEHPEAVDVLDHCDCVACVKARG